jgi:carboxylate-amine ligase
MDDLQMVGRRFITQGLHVHIGIDDEAKVIKVNNSLRIHLPLLLALSTSSPFYESVDTGLMSYRAKLFEALPLAGMPDSLRDWNEFNNLVQLLKMGGIIQTVKDLWWDVRPHPDFGTIEIRICDLPYSLRDILAITALIQSLVLTLAEEDEMPEPHSQILRSNKWQAARYGLEGVFVDPYSAQKHSMKEAVKSLYEMVKPVSEMLKSTEYLDEVHEILKRTTGAHIQKEQYYRNGNDFQAMIKSVQRMFLK